MNPNFLMNTASTLYIICYIPEFYANFRNKNANIYNVVEKVVILVATGFGLGYSIAIQNDTLIFNYAPLFVLDFCALSMRGYYAYRNRVRDVRALSIQESIPKNLSDTDIENPIHTPLYTF